MRFFTHNSLSDADMSLLQGTKIMTDLQRNRLVIVYDKDQKKATLEDMGLDKPEGLFYMRIPQQAQTEKNICEILFEKSSDLERVKESLVQYKLGID